MFLTCHALRIPDLLPCTNGGHDALLPPTSPTPLCCSAEKCTKLSKELASLQGEAVKQIEALKEGLARELRKQKVCYQQFSWHKWTCKLGLP